MMFGFRDIFKYLNCSNCGCLQILDIPENMNKYYSSNTYYSLNASNNISSLKKYFIKKRNNYAIFQKDFIGKLLFLKYPDNFLFTLGKLGLNYQSNILDVGCGNGLFLQSLKEIGFKNLLGLDPYIEKDLIQENLTILKKPLIKLDSNNNFDFIFFNHSFEHINEQFETLLATSKLLSKDGYCIVRMPIKNSFIWDLYGTNWVQIDAPRHFYIHTLKSFAMLANKVNLNIKEVIFDSTELQFWRSEQYKNDIPLKSKNSYAVNPKMSIFTQKQIKKFKRTSEELNKINLGDQATFILSK